MLSSPPPLEPAELPVNVLSITVTVPAGPVALPLLSGAKKLRAQFHRPPPLSTAELLVNVLPVTAAVAPASLARPPPSPWPPPPASAVLPANTLSRTVTVPPLWLASPPPMLAGLPEKATLLTVS